MVNQPERLEANNMNLGIKDGSQWKRYHKLYPWEGRKTLCLMIAIWLGTAVSWAFYLKPIAFLTPIFVIWAFIGFLWYIRLALSKHYYDKEEKRKREKTYYF